MPWKPRSTNSWSISVSIARMRQREPSPAWNVSSSDQFGTGGHEDGRVVQLAVGEPEEEPEHGAERSRERFETAPIGVMLASPRIAPVAW
jgi:hypothetical protein